MAFFNFDAHVPLSNSDALVSFRIKGEEKAAIMSDGMVMVKGLGFPDGSYITGVNQVSASPASPSYIDGGSF